MVHSKLALCADLLLKSLTMRSYYLQLTANLGFVKIDRNPYVQLLSLCGSFVLHESFTTLVLLMYLLAFPCLQHTILIHFAHISVLLNMAYNQLLMRSQTSPTNG